MSLNYHNLKEHPRNFRDVTGLKIEEFEKVVGKVRPEWEKVQEQKKYHGRTSRLPVLEDKILCIILYYRTYITYRFLSYLFNLHNSNICRLLKKMEPLLAKEISIKKDRTITPERILKILADVTEQPIQRPKDRKKRKLSYSGKKKIKHNEKGNHYKRRWTNSIYSAPICLDHFFQSNPIFKMNMLINTSTHI
ncbi:transposase family protein [Wolbachia endosymbiont of Nasonia vitripennis]